VRRRTLFTLALALLAEPGRAGHPAPEEPLRVLCTLPDLADIVERIGGDAVLVQAVAKGTENVHAVRLKPSHIVAASRADAFFELGLSLEHAWVPGLLETSRNARIRVGAPGFVNVSRGWQTIEVPQSLSREQGTDLHPEGNPHFNLDPRGGRHMARVVLEALEALRPQRAAEFRRRHAELAAELDVAEARWAALAELARGHKAVTYHTEFDYLLRSLGIELVATLEPKPGVAPTPRHVAEVIQVMRREKVDFLLTAAWSNTRLVDDVCKKSGAKKVELPSMVGGASGADSWIAMMDLCHRRIASCLGLAWPPTK